MRTLTRCYKYRLYPATDQQNTLVQWAGCRRFVWNWALHCKQTHYQATGQRLSYQRLAAMLVDLKRQPKTAFLRDCHSQPLQQALMDLETAFTHFFAKRAKYPRFKARKVTPHSLRFPQGVVVVDEHTISVPKIGLMQAIIHRPLLGTAKGATIKQDATGAWWVVFVCHINRPDVLLTTDNPVGIDVGLESFTTLSTGEKTTPPKFYRRSQKKLARAQRKLSRAQKGSNNRLKARKHVAKIHQKISNQRADWLHKHALGIVRQFDVVCIEDLNLKGLAKTKLAKSFSDAALSTFMQMLHDKAEWHGRRVIKVGRFYASSKTCHHCQTKTALMLSDRVWTCPTCGTIHDRDRNAAINIVHEGIRLLAVGTTES
ncbi:MAG TPA: transposase [Herpetosiphon sp.]|uniref:Transposase, IS605 OrfB family n=1 Tax=Herpetosiphon aurantiacus (strain ATCC 23779 / DSM 785 / 114-95) TaxID=316274 RepID=A9B218_HERA2|nr:RNA-guided endonuclease TnpB family protein [Herpetosiphon sp.]ABX07368.1 transposase, IS605 OrfB family [Herpetosiphon aurantiacus DSM 785]HBW48431.1 transposase [Herpetosiphon sp.]